MTHTFWYFIYKYLYENTDERVQDYPMMKSVSWIYLIAFSYLIFVKSLGPRIMKDRPAFDLKWLLIIYNTTQAVANLWLGVYSLKLTYLRADWSLWCQPYMPNDPNDSDQHRLYGRVAYAYFLLKVSDLLGTVFFVLRKKSNQITFLHVYHHSMMLVTGYFFVKNMVLGHLALMPLINTYAHAIMCTYFLATCLSPKLRGSFWWKKHVTQSQLLQFFILFFHFGRPLVMQDCDYPNFVLAMGFLQNLLMIVLFTAFYRKTYLQTQPPPLKIE